MYIARKNLDLLTMTRIFRKTENSYQLATRKHDK